MTERGTYCTRGPGMWVPVAPAAGQGEAGTYRTRGPGMQVPAAGQGEAGDLPYPRFTNAGARLRPRMQQKCVNAPGEMVEHLEAPHMLLCNCVS